MSTPNTHLGAQRISELLDGKKSIFFIGIGGINMSSLAHISKKRGFRVGGSDRARTELTEKLSAAGIDVSYRHSAENIHGYDAVVYTVAISPDNPEYLEAARLGIPRISRADFLGYIMTSYKKRLGISGMHGKSTCTSMCAEIFIRAEVSPTVLSGAELSIMDGAYSVGEGEDFIFEACEYMDSFLDFNPTVAVILNIELDHVDYFSGLEQIRDSFAKFSAIAGKDGYAVVNSDDADVMLSVKDTPARVISFGIDNSRADYRAVDIRAERGRYSFGVLRNGERFCEIALSVTGYHNVYNALAAAAAADICGIRSEDIEKGLHAFRGAKRRMEYRGKLRGCEIYSDYGHHPTEIETTLKGAKSAAEGRLVCLFQPHTYSRTKALFDDFAAALSVADRVLLCDVYAAREQNDGSVSSALLAERIGGKAVYCGGIDSSASALSSELREGDTAIVMGAGDVYKVIDLLLAEKEKKDE